MSMRGPLFFVSRIRSAIILVSKLASPFRTSSWNSTASETPKYPDHHPQLSYANLSPFTSTPRITTAPLSLTESDHRDLSKATGSALPKLGTSGHSTTARSPLKNTVQNPRLTRRISSSFTFQFRSGCSRAGSTESSMSSQRSYSGPGISIQSSHTLGLCKLRLNTFGRRSTWMEENPFLFRRLEIDSRDMNNYDYSWFVSCPQQNYVLLVCFI